GMIGQDVSQVSARYAVHGAEGAADVPAARAVRGDGGDTRKVAARHPGRRSRDGAARIRHEAWPGLHPDVRELPTDVECADGDGRRVDGALHSEEIPPKVLCMGGTDEEDDRNRTYEDTTRTHDSLPRCGTREFKHRD